MDPQRGPKHKCRQGIRSKPGQTTVAPIKAWRGSLAEPPRPLTAPRDKPSKAGFAIHFIAQSTILNLRLRGEKMHGFRLASQ